MSKHVGDFFKFCDLLRKPLVFRKFDGAQKNMPNHYLKLEFLKLHFVCFCFAADCQANPTDISSKKSGKIQT